MSRIVALDNESVTVACEPERGIVHHVTHRFVVSATFRQALAAGLELMEAHHASKWLFDDRRNGVLSDDDLSWATLEWRPRAMAAGFRTWAIVMPEAVLGQMRARRVADYARRVGLTVEVFTDAVAARRWLERQPAGGEP